MNLSAPFIRRPIATSLLAVALLLSGVLGWAHLPVAPLPNVTFPVIVVQVTMAGASPDTMAATVAAPLERRLGTIADVNQLTSVSTVGATMIIIQFGLDRDIDGAARDVQAAIQAARADLPPTLRSNPTYRQFNPADTPVMVLGLTSATLTRAQLYDSASSVIQQQLSQIDGVGQITLGGGALPAVRVEIEPGKLAGYGISLEDVRAAIGAANANSAKGHLDVGPQRFEVVSNDQLHDAAPFRELVIAYRNDAAVRLGDVASVLDSTENIRNAGLYDGKPAILVIVYPMPGGNVVATANRIRAVLPAIEAALPHDIRVGLVLDRSESVRASVTDTGRTLAIAVILVIGVVFVFLRSPRAVLIPATALPLSIIGTFGPMYLLGYSIDNLSLMALTIGTGFVVDDAVVVLENITRHLEAGEAPREAALRGSAEVGFTVVSMSLSLIAVFLPILLMPGIVGLLFHEFAMTLSIAILLSMVVSLTLTPAMCAVFLRRDAGAAALPRWRRAFERGFDRLRNGYSRTLDATLDHAGVVAILLVILVVANPILLARLPATFFPEQDTGILVGQIIADQSTSFPAMARKLGEFQAIVQQDPAVAAVGGFTGGRALNTGTIFVGLKPLSERHLSAAEVVNRLRPRLDAVPGARLFLQAQQDLRIGGRQSAAEYQYTLTSDDADALALWVPRLVAELARHPDQVLDVNSDLQQRGLETRIEVARQTAARYGFAPNQIDTALYDAFGQRTVSTLYNPMNQYSVVMEFAPPYTRFPQGLDQVYLGPPGSNVGGALQTQMTTVTPTTAPTAAAATASPSGTAIADPTPTAARLSGAAAVTATTASSVTAASQSALAAADGSAGTTAATTATTALANQQANAIANSRGGGSSGSAISTSAQTMVPLSAMATWRNAHTATQVNHQGGSVAATISFNLPPGGSLTAARASIDAAAEAIRLPTTIHGSFAGAAQAFAQSMGTIPLLIIGALATVYLVLGVLYESAIHPLTILSTLPSAGIGATAALWLTGTPFSVIAMIGMILLIGIVKKNGIMMVDVAIQFQRVDGLDPRRAIHDAAVIRLRPILMTTAAAVLGAIPLAIGIGQGASLRQPLGVTVVGGLVVSQIFTLYTTPVIYLYLARLGARLSGWAASLHRPRQTGAS